MRKEEKREIIDSLAAQLEQTPNFYLTDISGLNAETTAKLRRECFQKQIKLVVVKNTLLRKALEKRDIAEAQLLYSSLEGPSAVMFSEAANAPAKLIKSFGTQYGKPVFKSALVQECAYVGENQLEALINIKSREELIGDIVALLQSPAKNVISALQSNAGGKVAGIVKRLSEKE
ncbi:MAG: 50S ribosomal protein L10 [Prolixibacteraceae bacterium]|nr:50S ribosomal protein L10 [Prolixibacteraceae bacterium]